MSTPRRSSIAFGVALLLAGCSSPAVAPPPKGHHSPHQTHTPPARLSVSAAGFELPAPVQRVVAVVQGSQVLLAGGLDAGGASTNGVFTLDPSSGHVSQLGSVPQAFHDAAGALLGGRLVVFGGGSSTSVDTVQAFDLGSKQGSVIGHLPTALSDLSSAVIGATVYLVGGYDGQTPQSAIYATTNGTSFRKVGELSTGLRYTAVAVVDGKVIVAGGTPGTGAVDTVQSFDPSTGKTTVIGHLPASVAHAAAVVLGGAVYVIGGQDASGHAVRTVTRIDPATGAVTRMHPLAQPVSDAGVAQTADRAWLVGGWRGTTVSQILIAGLSHHP